MTTTLAPSSQTKIIEVMDFELKCEAVDGCDRTAAILIYFACGKCVMQMCMPCRDHDYQYVTKYSDGDAWYCTCNFRFERVHRWEDLVIREVPL